MLDPFKYIVGSHCLERQMLASAPGERTAYPGAGDDLLDLCEDHGAAESSRQWRIDDSLSLKRW